MGSRICSTIHYRRIAKVIVSNLHMEGKNNIPTVIHYCWFGGKPLPALAVKCIESWKKYLPDYEIKRWDESNFDVNLIPYTQQAYEAKKYAFVSDYARFWILYKYGGLYFDTDVEVIKPMDDLIAAGPFMSSCYSDYEFKNLYKDWFIYIKYNKRIPILQKCCMYISVQGFHTVALIFFKIYAKGLYILKKSIKKMT